MALAAVTVQGGVIVSGIPIRLPGERWKLSFTSDSLLEIGTRVETNAGILGTQYGSLMYLKTDAGAAAGPGETIYLATTERISYTDPSVVQAIMGELPHLPGPGALANVVTSVGSSGQVRFVSADMPSSELPIVRICCRFQDPSLRWIPQDPFGEGGTIHQESRDPISTINDISRSVALGNEVYTTTEQNIPGTYRTLYELNVSFSNLTIGGVSITGYDYYVSYNSDADGETDTHNPEYSTSQLLFVSGAISADVRQTLRINVTPQGRDTVVLRLLHFSGNRYTLRRESGGYNPVYPNVTSVFVFSGLQGSTVADGQHGDLWIKDLERGWTNSNGRWQEVTALNLTGGSNVIRVFNDTPSRSVGNSGDLAVRRIPGETFALWEKGVEAERVIMQPTFPFMIDELTDGQDYDFHLAVVNLNGMGPELTVTETPTDTPLAPSPPVAQVANGGEGITAWIDQPDSELTAIEWEYRDREDDGLGNQEGYQRLQEGNIASVVELPVTVGSEARVRAVQVRNPSSAGPEVVVNEVGITDTGIRIPDGYRTRPFPGPGKLYGVLMKLESHPDGRKFRTFGHPVFTPEDVPPEFTELGAWVTGMDVPVGGVVTNVIRAPAGERVTADVPRQFIAIKAHIATGPTEPGIGTDVVDGEAREIWREYWRSFGEWVRFFVQGEIPDEMDDVDPEEEVVPPSEDDPPETAYVLQMNNVVTPADGAGGLRGVGEAGEFAFVYRSATGALRLIVWEVVKKRTTTLVLALLDRIGADRTRYHEGIQPGDFVIAWWSDTRWIRFDILSAQLSQDGRKCVIEVLPTRFVETGGTGDIVDGNMEFRFSRNPPVLTVPEASPVPTVPTSLTVTYDVQDSQHYTGTSLAADFLKLEIGAPANGDTPFTYEARIGYKHPAGHIMDIVAGGPEVQGQRYWDGDLNPSTATWPTPGRPAVNNRRAGVDTNGDLFLPRIPFIAGPGPATTRAITGVVEYVEVRAGNPDGEYGPRLRVNGSAIVDGRS